VAERIRAEQERERRRQLAMDLAHLNRVSLMGEPAASVAHEVNQPLSGVVRNGARACGGWPEIFPTSKKPGKVSVACSVTGTEPLK
jgi:hypothetical protein